MTIPSPAAQVTEPQGGATTRLAAFARWLQAVVRTTRPRQWPKNLLVFAAPLAAGSLGRDHGFAYALPAMFAFGWASAAASASEEAVASGGSGRCS